ncbi:MAG: CapA family protein [Clostridia bacterium]|nr:CapA family protein [Clostridia bacterium]
MLFVTVLVLGMCGYALPRLMGEKDLSDAGNRLGDQILYAIGNLQIEEQAMEARNIPLQAAEDVQISTPTSTPVFQGGDITLTLGGTVALEKVIRQSGYDKSSRTYDFREILYGISPIMQGDIRLIGLENLIMPSKSYTDIISPDELSDLLSYSGANTLMTAFPKGYDQGMEGITETLMSLQSRDLETAGMYMSEGEAAVARRIQEIRGMKVAVLGYSETLSSAGTKQMRKDDRSYALPLAAQAKADIEIARNLGAHLVVVCISWGEAGKTTISASQRQLAQEIADAGADLIVGYGSRRIQEITYLSAQRDSGQAPVLCIYGIGNLLSSSTKTGALGGMLLHVQAHVDQSAHVSFSELTATPTFIWRFQMDGKTVFRVVAADREADGMSADQKKKQASALDNTRKALEGSPVSLR